MVGRSSWDGVALRLTFVAAIGDVRMRAGFPRRPSRPAAGATTAPHRAGRVSANLRSDTAGNAVCLVVALGHG